jgi:hypothetical protein
MPKGMGVAPRSSPRSPTRACCAREARPEERPPQASLARGDSRALLCQTATVILYLRLTARSWGKPMERQAVEFHDSAVEVIRWRGADAALGMNVYGRNRPRRLPRAVSTIRHQPAQPAGCSSSPQTITQESRSWHWTEPPQSRAPCPVPFSRAAVGHFS